MTFVKTDPSTMTDDERSDYRARTGTDAPVDTAETTVEVRFSAAEHAAVVRRAEAADLSVVDYLRTVALG